MKHTGFVELRHASAKKNTVRVEILPLSINDPGGAYLRQEIETNRKAERWLVPKAIISLLLVGILVTIRLVYFS